MKQITAKEFAYNINNSPLLTLSKPEAKLDLKDIVIAEDSDNIQVADAQFHFQANALDYEGMKFNELNIYAEANKIKYSEKDNNYNDNNRYVFHLQRPLSRARVAAYRSVVCLICQSLYYINLHLSIIPST